MVTERIMIQIDMYSWWCQGTETLATLLALCEGNRLGTGGFLSQKTSNMELWCFICCSLKQTFEQTVKRLFTWDPLTHWDRVMHICLGKLTIIGSDNGLSPGRRQAIIWTNASILSIGPLGTNFSEISIKIDIFPFKKIYIWICCMENGGHFVSASMC